VSLSREEQLQARIEEAHKAWLAKQAADAHLERLGRYKALNKAMREDLARYQREAREANATLSRVLGRQP
jgi:hypothetical protein